MWRHSSASAYVTTAGFLLGAVLALASFHLLGAIYLNGFALDLGSLNFPTPGYLTAVAFWMPFGALAAVLLALALVQAAQLSGRMQQLAAEWESLPDRRFLIWATAAGFLIPFAIRHWVLHDAPLADDDAAYRFAAELLASGRLWVSSPPMKLFFDQNFMINDGRLYPVYFLGWPALMAPGVWIGATGLMNPIYSALTVPPLVGALGHLVGRSWARAGAVLFLSAPFLQIGAATELSHTTCLMALTWCLWVYLRITHEPTSLRLHAGFAFAFALAFCVRPQSALPLGLPLILAWLLTVWRLDPAPRARAALAFLAPAAVMALLFLGALWAQNGSPFRMGYARYAQYMIDNRFRFTTFTLVDLTAVPGFDFSQIGTSIARAASGLFRLNIDLFGWPASFALMLCARAAGSPGIRVLWTMTAASVLFQLFQRDWGTDTFGPVHAFELSLPILCLTIVGARQLTERMTPRGFPAALLAALIVTAWVGFIPVRLQAVRQIAAHINVALHAPDKAGLARAVIFSPRPFASPCGGSPRHFVFFRPTNDPDLENGILWVNDLGPEENRRFLSAVGGDRPGFGLRWTSRCDVELDPVLHAPTLSDNPR
jgi:hypothetical protein